MERTAEVVRLYRAAKDVAAGLGFDLGEGGTGGASDGNFTAALGIPTLDGLGALGDGAHAIDEHASIPALSRQAALLAGLLVELGGGAPACQVLRLTSTMTYCSLRTQC
jgi:glutamate carboxypeptidase